jgi:hypothetical protein
LKLSCYVAVDAKNMNEKWHDRLSVCWRAARSLVPSHTCLLLISPRPSENICSCSLHTARVQFHTRCLFLLRTWKSSGVRSGDQGGQGLESPVPLPDERQERNGYLKPRSLYDNMADCHKVTPCSHQWLRFTVCNFRE